MDAIPDKKKGGQEIGLIFGTTLVGLALYPMLEDGAAHARLAAAGMALLVTAIIAPRLLYPLYALWMKLALLLSKVITPLVMGIVFFGILTPVGGLLRLMGKDLLLIRKDKRQNKTFWQEKDDSIPFDMNRQF